MKYRNVFGLGDAGSTANSKTAAAVRKQSPVVVKNLLHLISGGAPEAGYDGYASCPLTTAYGKVLMAEFIYGGKVTPTFPLDPRREHAVYWWVKTTGLPLMYWDYMLKGYQWFPKHNTNWTEPGAAPWPGSQGAQDAFRSGWRHCTAASVTTLPPLFASSSG